VDVVDVEGGPTSGTKDTTASGVSGGPASIAEPAAPWTMVVAKRIVPMIARLLDFVGNGPSTASM
jgi:hypothetical protein